MDVLSFVLLGVAAVGGGCAWRLLLSDSARFRRAMARARWVPIGEVPDGEVVKVILVELDSPKVRLVMDVESALWPSTGPGKLQARMGAAGGRHRDVVGERRRRFREGVLAPDERVAVVGVCRWEVDPSYFDGPSTYREPPRRPTLRAANGCELLVSDDPALLGDGDRLSPTARRTSARTATGSDWPSPPSRSPPSRSPPARHRDSPPSRSRLR